jgi:hypothetical protein
MASRFGLAAIVLLLSIAHAAAGKAALGLCRISPIVERLPAPPDSAQGCLSVLQRWWVRRRRS